MAGNGADTNGKITGVIFDLGGVVVDWDPRKVYRDIFAGDEKKVDWFLSEICPPAWNDAQDAGAPIAEMTDARVALFPEWEKEIRAYYGRWIDMIGEAVPGTTELICDLDRAGYALYALSNWSAETFPLVRHRFAAFDRFRKIFLSGEYKMIKPDAQFYNAALAEIPLPTEELIFTDDNPKNVAGAEAVGLTALPFTDADTLRADLRARGMRV